MVTAGCLGGPTSRSIKASLSYCTSPVNYHVVLILGAKKAVLMSHHAAAITRRREADNSAVAEGLLLKPALLPFVNEINSVSIMYLECSVVWDACIAAANKCRLLSTVTCTF